MKSNPSFLEWKAAESEFVETKSARVPEGGSEWKLDRCPWWLDAQLRGDQVEVRPNYFGQFRGKVWIRATSGVRSSLRVSTGIRAPESALREARRRALWRALWTQLAFVAVGLFVMQGAPGALMDAPLPLWILLSSATWGRMEKDRALMLPSLFAMAVSMASLFLFWRIALEHSPSGLLPPLTSRADGVLGPLVRTFGMALWPVLLVIHGGLLLSVWGGCVGGWRLALRAGWRGALLTLICFGLLPFAGYLIYAAIFLGTFLWLICWQRMLGALLPPVPRDPSFSTAVKTPGTRQLVIRLTLLAVALFAATVGYAFYLRSPYALSLREFTIAGPTIVPMKGGVPEGVVVRTFPVPVDTHKPLGLTASGEESLFWSDDGLVGLDTRTGVGWRWRPQRRWPFSKPIAGPDGAVYVFGGGGAYLHSFQKDGRRKWSVFLGEACFGTIADGNGNVYTAGKKTVYAVDANGKRRWTYPSVESMYVSHLLTVASDGALYLPGEKMLQAITPAGQRKWSISLPAGCHHAAASPDGGVYVGLFDDTIRLFDSSGHERSKTPTASSGDFAVDSEGVIYFEDLNRQFCAMNPDGHLRWTLKMEGRLVWPPVLGADGTVLACWENAPSFVVNAIPQRVYAATYYAISPQGKVEWSLPVDLSMSPAVISPRGSVSFRTADGKIVVVEKHGIK